MTEYPGIVKNTVKISQLSCAILNHSDSLGKNVQARRVSHIPVNEHVKTLQNAALEILEHANGGCWRACAQVTCTNRNDASEQNAALRLELPSRTCFGLVEIKDEGAHTHRYRNKADIHFRVVRRQVSRHTGHELVRQ
jgi:hypothetical protein